MSVPFHFFPLLPHFISFLSKRIPTPLLPHFHFLALQPHLRRPSYFQRLLNAHQVNSDSLPYSFPGNFSPSFSLKKEGPRPLRCGQWLRGKWQLRALLKVVPWLLTQPPLSGGGFVFGRVMSWSKGLTLSWMLTVVSEGFFFPLSLTVNPPKLAPFGV
ncbi:hypothetical protein LIER_27631 [Lithospermum erythrorhizon]|uniref:Uncharacterized protein n=1 Tax=Lithospermum erythrorhizon TaxID=34254 RepID=A0AAV3REF3_LITER